MAVGTAIVWVGGSGVGVAGFADNAIADCSPGVAVGVGVAVDDGATVGNAVGAAVDVADGAGVCVDVGAGVAVGMSVADAVGV